MRPFAMISSSLWRSRKFRRLQTDAARLLYFFLHTHEGGNSLGAFHMSPDQAALAMRRSSEELEAAYSELQSVELIQYDAEEELVRIVGFVTHSPPSSYKHLAGLDRVLEAIAAGPIWEALAAEMAEVLDKKAATWSDEVSSKQVFQKRAKALRAELSIIQGPDTPIHTPIIEAGQDTPIHTPMDTRDHTETETETIKRKKQDVGGGGVLEPTDRERLLVAMGHDQSGVTANGRLVGNQADMMVFNQWRDDLGLTLDEVLSTIAEVRMGSAYPTPGPFSFKFFNSPMQRLAGQKSEPALKPEQGAQNVRGPNQDKARRPAPHQSGGVADRASRLRGASLVPDDPE